MASDDYSSGRFPTRTGTPSGKTNERTMLDTVGGKDGIRTRVVGDTLLKTGGGFARFVNTKAPQVETTPLRRGFVLAGPVLTLLTATKSLLMRFVTVALGLWEKNYRVNAGTAHVPYFVADTASVQKKVTAEDSYNDVYCLLGKTLYKNSLVDRTLTESFGGVPYIRGGSSTVLSVVTNSSTALINGTALVEEFSMGNFADPLAPGATVSGGVLVDRSEHAAKFCTMLYTSAGALQIWRATASLASLARQVDTTFEQKGVRGETTLVGGWTFEGEEQASMPRFNPPAITYIMGGLYDAVDDGGDTPHSYLSSLVISDALVPASGKMVSVDRYARSASDSVTHDLYEGVTATVATTVMADAEYRPSVPISYYCCWPLTYPLYRTQPYPESGYYIVNVPQSYGVKPPTLEQGGILGWLVNYSESVRYLNKTSSASISASVNAVDREILTIDVQGTKYHASGGVNVVPSLPMSPGPRGTAVFGQGAFFAVTHDDGYYTAKSDEIVTWSVSGVSRDYFYVDTDNAVFAWVEGMFTSSGEGETASTTITVAVVVSIFGVEQRSPAYVWGSATGLDPNLTSPNINFGTGVPWKYHAPVAPHPIYAPLWCDQGLCPHIAYTTLAESVSEPTWFYSFALRIHQLFPPIGYSPPPLSAGEFAVFAPMFEWMVGYYGSLRILPMWYELRGTMFRLSGSSEGDGDWEANVTGKPSGDLQPYIYRT